MFDKPTSAIPLLLDTGTLKCTASPQQRNDPTPRLGITSAKNANQRDPRASADAEAMSIYQNVARRLGRYLARRLARYPTPTPGPSTKIASWIGSRIAGKNQCFELYHFFNYWHIELLYFYNF